MASNQGQAISVRLQYFESFCSAVPLFSGQESDIYKARQWIRRFKTMSFFTKLSESEKINFALFRLTGPADEWSEILEKLEKPKTFEEFANAFIARFQPENRFKAGQCFERMLSINPGETVDQLYWRILESMIQWIDYGPLENKIPKKFGKPSKNIGAPGDGSISEETRQSLYEEGFTGGKAFVFHEFKKDLFMRGLPQEIRRLLAFRNFTSFDDIRNAAIIIEQEIGPRKANPRRQSSR